MKTYEVKTVYLMSRCLVLQGALDLIENYSKLKPWTVCFRYNRELGNVARIALDLISYSKGYRDDVYCNPGLSQAEWAIVHAGAKRLQSMLEDEALRSWHTGHSLDHWFDKDNLFPGAELHAGTSVCLTGFYWATRLATLAAKPKAIAELFEELQRFETKFFDLVRMTNCFFEFGKIGLWEQEECQEFARMIEDIRPYFRRANKEAQAFSIDLQEVDSETLEQIIELSKPSN